MLPAQESVNSGKIYIVDNLLFVGEGRKGFHVFDNSDPANPIKIKFIQALGSSDLAIRNNVLYINQATDLIALEYNVNEDKLEFLKRIENTFPELRSPNGNRVNTHSDSVVVDWEVIEIISEL